MIQYNTLQDISLCVFYHELIMFLQDAARSHLNTFMGNTCSEYIRGFCVGHLTFTRLGLVMNQISNNSQYVYICERLYVLVPRHHMFLVLVVMY